MNFGMTAEAKIERIEEILDYQFKNKDLVRKAITHPSAVEGDALAWSYERLEFLGDSILGAIVAHEIYMRYQNINEGGMTRIKVALVSGTMLARVALDLGITNCIIFGASEAGTGKRGLNSALENVFEALVGALYLDSGVEKAREFVSLSLFRYMDVSLAHVVQNPKSALQEWMQKEHITPSYELLEMQGPPHERVFITQVKAGDKVLAQGEGRSKKESESNAARAALEKLEACDACL